VLYSHFASHPRNVPIRFSRPLNPPPSHSKLGRYLKSLELDLLAIAMEDQIRLNVDPDTQDPPIWSLYADLLKRCHMLVSLTLLELPEPIPQALPTLNLLKLIPPTLEHVSAVLFNSAAWSGAILLEFLERQPNLQSIHLNKPMQLNLVAYPSPVHLHSLRKISTFSPWDAQALAKNCISTNLKAMLFSMPTTFKDLQWAQETLKHVEWVFMPYVLFPAAWDAVKPFKNIRFFGIFQFTSEEVSSILPSFVLLPSDVHSDPHLYRKMKAVGFSPSFLHSNLSQSCSPLVQIGTTRIVRRSRRSALPTKSSQVILEYRGHTWSNLLCAPRTFVSCCRRTNLASGGSFRDSKKVRQSEICGLTYDRARCTFAVVGGTSAGTGFIYAASNESRAATEGLEGIYCDKGKESAKSC
jgi:hypothetical protein